MDSSTLTYVGLGLFLCAVAAAFYYLHRKAEEKRKNDRRAATRKKELDKFYTSPLQPLEKVADITADDGEVFYYGGFAEWERRPDGAQPQAYVKSPGMLYLSNQRLCFVSALGGEERMVFGSWAGSKIHPDAIELRMLDGNTIFIHSDDMLLGPVFGRLTKKQFDPLHK